MYLPRMRTIEQSINIIRENDPQSSFTKTALRRMIINKEIPSIKAGCKYLVDIDSLCEYLRNPIIISADTLPSSGGINKIEKHLI